MPSPLNILPPLLHHPSAFQTPKTFLCLLPVYIREMLSALDFIGGTFTAIACALIAVAATSLISPRKNKKAKSPEETGDTPLMIAIQSRDLKLIRHLLENGADPNACNKKKISPLHLAATSSRPELVTLLLDHGANINAVNKKGEPALWKVAALNLSPAALLLLKRGADVNLTFKDSISPLVTAANRGYDDMVLLLLKHGADVPLGTHVRDLTPLYWAVNKCSYTTAKALLDAGANPFHISKENRTLLDMAKDENMKRLICEYQKADGPSSLMQALWVLELQWETICDVVDKLAKENLTTRDSFACTPLAHFTHAYLERIGITSLSTRLTLLELRLRSTWLGERLEQAGMCLQALEACEHVVMQRFGCETEASFARVLPEELTDESLAGVTTMTAPLRRCLREVHAQVCKTVRVFCKISEV